MTFYAFFTSKSCHIYAIMKILVHQKSFPRGFTDFQDFVDGFKIPVAFQKL